jgi:glycosyltransferase involved in cell wall biosynthesis
VRWRARPSDAATSVILATFDGERHLAPLLESLRRQELPPYEVIVSDDGSTDRTLDIVRAFAASAPFPVVVTETRGSVGHAGNFLGALELATGRYAAWCDQDDIWSPRKLRWCQDLLDRLPLTMVVHGARRIDASGGSLGSLGGMRAPVQRRMEGNRFAVPHGFRQVFRRDLFAGLSPDDRPMSTPGHERALHDEWAFMLANAAGSILWLPARLVEYRVHGLNHTPAAREPSIWARSVGDRSADDPNRQRARAASERARHLQGLAEHRDGRDQERASRSAEAYRRAAGRYLDRAAVYDARSRGDRARTVARLVRRGTYRSGARGGLGPRALVRDLLEVGR